MVNKPSTVDEAIAYIWDFPETILEPSEKQSLAAALAQKTDAAARWFFSAPSPELWVGTLKVLLQSAGILPFKSMTYRFGALHKHLSIVSGVFPGLEHNVACWCA